METGTRTENPHAIDVDELEAMSDTVDHIRGLVFLMGPQLADCGDTIDAAGRLLHSLSVDLKNRWESIEPRIRYGRS